MEKEATRYKINVPDLKKLNALVKVLQDQKIPVFGFNRAELWISSSKIPEILLSAITSLGCTVVEDELDDDTCVTFPDKVDLQIGLAMNAMKDREARVIPCFVRTTISIKQAEDMLADYIWQPYPGLGSMFVMTLSKKDIEELVAQEWVRFLSMPRKLGPDR